MRCTAINFLNQGFNTYFYTMIQKKVHQRIAKLSRVLSNIYLQQNNLMNHSSNDHTYMHAYIIFTLVVS